MAPRKANKRFTSMNRRLKLQKLSVKSRKDAVKNTVMREHLEQEPSVAECRSSSRHDLARDAVSYWASAAASRMTPIEHATRHGSAAAVDKAHAIIDAEIEAALVAVSNMRSRHYMLPPISTLPEDVLALVFAFLSESDPFHSGSSRTSWIVVTFVCRVWRQTALAHSRLWSEISTELPPEWIKLFFERARTAPLAIAIQQILPSGNERKLELIQNHLWHTTSIHFSGTLRDFRYLVEALERGAPQLTVLELMVDDPGLYWRSPTLTDSLMLSLAFFKCTPKLHTLRIRASIYGLTLSWASLPWPNLRCLEVTGPYINAIPDLPLLFHCLASASRLEKLRLVRCLPSHVGITDLDKQTVHFPFLRSLSICGVLESCVALWNALDIPSMEDFRLGITEGWSLNKSYLMNGIAPILRKYVNTAAAQDLPPYQTLVVNQNAPSHISISAWRSVRSTQHTFTLPKDEPYLRLDLPYRSARSFHGSGDFADIETIYKIIGVDHLRALSVSVHSEGAWSKKTWLAIFGNAKHIQTIRLFDVAAFEFSKALVPTITRREDPSQVGPSSSWEQNRGRGDHDGGSGGYKSAAEHTPACGPLFMQSLESIQFCDVPFERAYEGKPLFEDLPIRLRERLAAPANKLTALIISDCHVRNRNLAGLRQIENLQMDWDECVNDPDDDDA